MPASGRDSPPDELIETPYGYMARYGRHIRTVGTASPEQQEEMQRHLVAQVLPEIESRRDELQTELRHVLESVDARELLMQLAIPYLHIDPNTWRESESHQLPSYIEYLAVQVLGVDQPAELHGPGDTDPRVYGAALSKVEALIRELFDLEIYRIQIKTHLDEAASSLSLLEREARSKAITEAVLVRYNVYAKHCRQLAEGLFADLDGLLLRHVGFTIRDALAIYDAFGEIIYEPLFKRRERSHAFIDARMKEVKRARRKPTRHEDDDELQRLAAMSPRESRRQLENAGAAWMFYGSREHTRITVEALSAASRVSADRCLAFLGLMTAESNEYAEKFHRFPAPTNPLQTKPFIRDGNGWLLPIPGQVLIALVPRLEDALKENDEAWNTYTGHRGAYLEDVAERLLAQALPGCRTWKRRQWASAEAKGELDVVVSYDDVTLLVQCKSGRVTQPAWRGAIHRMRDDLAKLVGDAASQHRSFRDALKTHTASELVVRR